MQKFARRTHRLPLLLALLLLVSLLLVGCNSEKPLDSNMQHSNIQGVDYSGYLASMETLLQSVDGYELEDVDIRWDAPSATTIQFNGTTATISGSGVSQAGSTITISAAGTYILSGTLDDGQVIIDTNNNALVRLVFQGVSLSCSTNAPLYAAQARKTVVILAEGTENYLQDAVNYVYPFTTDEPDAALFAKDDLSITGSGTLQVQGNFKNGIGTKDELRITGGTITISAVNDGLRGRDGVYIYDGAFVIDVGNDGIKANNSENATKGFVTIQGGDFIINALHDGVQAETALTITGGQFAITSGGGSAAAPIRPNSFGGRGVPIQPSPEESESMKGVKAGVSVLIEGGNFTIDSEDDAVHSNGTMVIIGGNFTISTGDDAFHANLSLRIEDGVIDVLKSYEGLESLAIDIHGGSIAIIASDDGINSSGENAVPMTGGGMQGGNQPRFGVTEGAYLRVTGGNIEITAANDGIDSNGHLYIEGGSLHVNGASMGADGSIDLDGNFVLSGGNLITAGSVYSASTASTQPLVRVSYTQQYPIGTLLAIRDAYGSTLLEYESKVAFSASGFSSPLFTLGDTYTLYLDDEKMVDITVSSITTSVSSNGGMYSEGMGGGNRGGGWAGQGQFPEGELDQFPQPGSGIFPERMTPGQPFEGEQGQLMPGNRGQRPQGEQPRDQVPPAITQ